MVRCYIWSMEEYLENRIKALREAMESVERQGVYYWRYKAKLEEAVRALEYLTDKEL